MKNPFLRFLAISVVLSFRTPAYGVEIANTFGPNDTYNTAGYSAVWNIISPGSSVNVGQGFATKFSVNGDYSLSSVTLALGYIQDTNNLGISIVADNSGAPTGALLETIASHPTDITNLYSVRTYRSSLNPVMASGNSFWLVIQPVDYNAENSQNNAAYAWYTSENFGSAATRDYNFTTTSWDAWHIYAETVLPAFRIEGTTVPEPNALQLMLVGLAWLGFRGWKNSRLKT